MFGCSINNYICRVLGIFAPCSVRQVGGRFSEVTLLIYRFVDQERSGTTDQCVRCEALWQLDAFMLSKYFSPWFGSIILDIWGCDCYSLYWKPHPRNVT